MAQEFQKPFASPPTIFLVALIAGICAALIRPWSVLHLAAQLSIGPLLVLAGAFLIQRSIKEIESAGSTYDPYDVSTALVTSGVYKYSRNPGYLGLALIHFGFAILIDSIWIVITGLVAAFITSAFVIRLEERKLADAFGDAYADYKARVRRWI